MIKYISKFLLIGLSGFVLFVLFNEPIHAVIGQECFNPGQCGITEPDPCRTGDCDFGEICDPNPISTPGGDRHYCIADTTGSCPTTASSCGDCAGTYGECGGDGGCPEGLQCVQEPSGGGYSCDLPLSGACGNCLGDGEDCSAPGSACCGVCSPTDVCVSCLDAGAPCTPGQGQCCGTCQNTGGPWYCSGGSGCLPEGSVCMNSSNQVLGTCCNSRPCTGGPDGQFYCGDPYAPPIPEPGAYAGPIIDAESFLNNAYRFFLPIAIGLIGIPTLIGGFYKIMTSQGDPSKLKDGQEMVFAAIVGLLFLLLSLSILRFVLNNFLGQGGP